jgi:hypothetical protein
MVETNGVGMVVRDDGVGFLLGSGVVDDGERERSSSPLESEGPGFCVDTKVTCRQGPSWFSSFFFPALCILLVPSASNTTGGSFAEVLPSITGVVDGEGEEGSSSSEMAWLSGQGQCSHDAESSGVVTCVSKLLTDSADDVARLNTVSAGEAGTHVEDVVALP